MKKIVIVGGTASGKTKLAYDIAKTINGEIISADSRQVYRYLDIGSSKERFKDVETHLIDIINPDQRYSAFLFKNDAKKIIKDIELKGKTPIIVGGTGLYTRALVYNLSLGKNPDFKLRKELGSKTKEELQYILYSINPKFKEILNNSDINNKVRLIRYIEKGEIIQNEFGPESSENNEYIQVQINIEKEKIIKRIRNRTDNMIKLGLVDETLGVLKLGYKKDAPGLCMIGYKESIEFIEHKLTHEELIEKINKNTINLLKRQITYFGNDKNIYTIDYNKILDFINMHI
ncbi:MAG: tRNA (adenosine(37)-N6)-dimethylallyltransferase MiaA [Patescibacteria group bacterium]